MRFWGSHLDASVFGALDFETANETFNSACAVGAVRVEDDVITCSIRRLIRPPTRRFRFTYLHGIDCNQVSEARPFVEVWAEVEEIFAGSAFIAAHNADFDRTVLYTCCRQAGISPPSVPFLCTMRLARRHYGEPVRLAELCQRLDITLKHHDPLSDAEAAARIVIGLRGSEERG